MTRTTVTPESTLIASLALRRRRIGGIRREAPPGWKEAVQARLAENLTRGVSPRNHIELAAAVGGTKSGIGKLLSETIGQTTSTLIDPITAVLRLAIPLRDVTAIDRKPLESPPDRRDPDSLDETLKWIPDDERDRAAAILRAVFGPRPGRTRDH